MDESRTMRMGKPSLATRRRASADSGRSSGVFRESEDFNDVFGGPPTSVLTKKLSCDFSSYDYFYREIFRLPEDEARRRRSSSSNRFHEFTIPLSHRAEDKAVFYNSSSISNHDEGHKEKRSSRIWRSLSKTKWTSKSKSNSKSLDSTIESGIREEDVGLNSFASKLRPINVPYRWNSSSKKGGIHKSQTLEAPFQYTNACYTMDDYYPRNEYSGENFTRSSNPCFAQQFPSPESEIPYSTTVRISVDDQLESPSPSPSSADDEVSSSYVIEINSGRAEISSEAADIDEAIAWAKGKFQGCASSSNNCRFGEERSMIPLVMEVPENVSERYPLMSLNMEQSIHHSSMHKENDDSSDEHLGTAELYERINSWSTGNETNIRQLLSTLHHVLWDSSGWNAIALSNLIEHSRVKKAYQKARLCIHPDKLQQRSATTPQKYIAQKAFSVLQIAWDSFISQEILST